MTASNFGGMPTARPRIFEFDWNRLCGPPRRQQVPRGHCPSRRSGQGRAHCNRPRPGVGLHG
eukprot:10776908-Prorocentrum_lima.AAC.1